MVQILPPKTNVGTQIGQSLGQGLQQGMNLGFQRGLLQQALGKVKDIANPAPIGTDQNGNPIYPKVNPLEALTALMEAGAGIPGSERYIGTLAPLLLGQLRTQQLYGEEAREGKPPLAPAEAAQEAQKYIQGPQPSGFLSAPMNPDEMQQYATRYAQVIGDPNAFDKGLQQAAQLNASRQQSRQYFEDAARGMGITEVELPRYLQLATRFQNLKDPAAINRATFNKFQEIKNSKKALRNLTVPGIGTKLFMEGGLIGALASGGETRQKYLKKYDDLVARLVNEGEEPYVREQLGKVGLSPTEIEERIHPLTPEMNKKISSLPSGNKMNAKAREDALVNFFRNNVSNNISLSVLRHYLWKDKKYNWEEIANAINLAFPEGENLTQNQIAELPTVNTPPKQSLIELFGPGGDIAGFFRGQR